MNNGQLKVTTTAVAFDVSAATIITLENTGDHPISIGFGDMDDDFVYGSGFVLNPTEAMTMESTDTRRGDGTFFAVTKDTPNSGISYLSYSADGGVAPALLAVTTPLAFAENVPVDIVPSITFSADIDDGVSYSIGLFDSEMVLVPGTSEIVGDTISYTPTDDLESNGYYTLIWRVSDFNDKHNSGVITFTVVIV